MPVRALHGWVPRMRRDLRPWLLSLLVVALSAAWLLLDLETWTAEWRRVEYPIDKAATAIKEAGLPLALADRLYHGQ